MTIVAADVDVSRELATFAATTPLREIPAAACAMGKQMLTTAISLAIGSAFEPVAGRAYSAVKTLRTPPQATVLGRNVRVGAGWAGFLNGIAAHAQDFDDTHLGVMLHASPPVVPAALATAELAHASGRALLEGVVLGAEVAMRVGTGLAPSHYDRGWHVTSTLGRLGAAIAAGRVLGLDAERMQHALGIAATETGGLSAANGTMAKPFHPGKAALDGIEAAVLARAGFTSASRSIEGRRGLGTLLADAPNYERMLRELGTHWEMTANAFKPYACGVLSHGLIDAAIALRERVPPERIVRVTALVHPATLGHMGIEEPKNGLESKFSARHCAAAGFIDGAAGPRQFSDARAAAPEIAAFRRKVKLVASEAVGKGGTVMTVEMIGGQTLTEEIPHASGSAECPMTSAQLAAKAKLVAGDELELLLALIDRVEDVQSMQALIGAAPTTPTG